MKIEIDTAELARLTNKICEQTLLIEALQARGTELIEENRRLKEAVGILETEKRELLGYLRELKEKARCLSES